MISECTIVTHTQDLDDLEDCESLDLSVGEAEVHIARDGQISFTPKPGTAQKDPMYKPLFGDEEQEVEEEDDGEEEEEEEEEDEEDEEDDLVPFNRYVTS